MNKVYLTLDYELFMGRNVGTIEHCLINPMTALINMLDKYRIKCNVFVDAAYLLRLYQLKDKDKQIKELYQLLTNHIQCISKQGHAIQLHFHPQWLYSKYEDGWKMNFDHYKISDMPKKDIESLIPEAIDLLQSFSLNKITAFRAGGYSFPNDATFLNILRRCNINIDTSVLKGASVESKYQTYNYSSIPSYSPYHFDENLCIDNVNGYFMEYPIATIKMMGYKYWLLKRNLTERYNKLNGNLNFGDGGGIGLAGGKWSQIKYKIIRLITPSIIPATLDGVLSLYLENVYSNHIQNSNHKAFVIIGHPKNLSKSSIEVFENFIRNHKNLEFCLF